MDKKNNILDSIKLTSRYYYLDQFTKCNRVARYPRDYHPKIIDLDNQFGDILVADLNFDKRDDIMVVRSCQNSGNYYNFHIQGRDKKFTLNRYLTDSMGLCPYKINPAKKTLTTTGIAGACGYGNNEYTLDKKKQNWSRKYTYYHICKE